MIKIDGIQFFPNVGFIISNRIQNKFPLKFNSQNVREINSFIGLNPFRFDKSVKKYLESEGLLKKLGYWKAKRKLKKYESRISFIGEFLFLPATWGQLVESIVPYRIDYIYFSKDLKRAEIKHETAASGEIAIYNYIEGKWIKTNTKMKWVD